MSVHAALQRQPLILHKGVRRQGENGDGLGIRPGQLPNLPCGGPAVHFRHLHVHKNVVVIARLMVPEFFQGNAAVFGNFHRAAHFLQDLLGDHGVGLVVLRQQNAPVPDAGAVSLRLRLLHHRLRQAFGQGQGDKYREVAALPRTALHHDLSLHQLHDLVRNGHAQAGAAVLMGNIHIFLFKRIENPADKLRCHADTGIVDPDHQVRRVVMEHHLPDGHDDLALLGEFYGVGQKVDDDLLQA